MQQHGPLAPAYVALGDRRDQPGRRAPGVDGVEHHALGAGDEHERVAHRLRHGTVWINDFHPYLPQAEWGGYKQSGIGRELGPTGLGEYQEAKHIHQNLRPEPPRWFDGR